jgi:hypothetical protein
MAKPALKLDWCGLDAAKYALKTWYYRDALPVGKTARIGIWEDDKFLGVLIFGTGANNKLAASLNLETTQCVELVRVAMGAHKSPVSRIMAIALRMIAKEYPGLRAIVSYCDPGVGHYGGIYQATNWIYTGLTGKIDYYRDAKGELHHWRSARLLQKKGVPLERVYQPGKHKYVYPLDPSLRSTIKSLPYPKPATETGDHPDQGQSEGALPIQSL